MQVSAARLLSPIGYFSSLASFPSSWIRKHLGPVILYLALITLLRWQWSWYLASLWAGGFLGVFIVYLDQLISPLFFIPNHFNRFTRLFYQRRWSELACLLTLRPSSQPITRSVLFEVLVTALAFYALTSATWFARGLVMGFWLKILSEQLIDYLNQGQISSWFRQINHPVPINWQVAFLASEVILFIVFSILLVI